MDSAHKRVSTARLRLFLVLAWASIGSAYRRVSIAVVLFLLILLGIWQAWEHLPRAFVSQVYAVSDERAVLLLRQNTSEATRFWISLQSTDGPVWVHRLPDDTRRVVGRSLTASDALVTYQRQTEDASEVVALAMDGGKPVWRTTLGATKGHDPIPFLYAHSRVHGPLLLEPALDELVALELDTGAIRWRTSLSATTMIQRYDSDGIWFVNNDNLLSKMSTEDGSVSVGPIVFRHCLDQDRILTLSDGVLQGEDGVPLAETLGQSGRLRACGRYKGDLVVTVFEDETVSLLRIRDGKLQQRLRLDWSPLNGLLGGQYETHRYSPLHGEMTRYLPLLVNRLKSSETALIVVDLETMQVKQTTAQDDYVYLEQLRVGSIHYFWYHGGLLFAMDGQTGMLTGAVRGGRHFSGHQLANGVVWMAEEGSAGWQRPRHPAAAWLDARSLEVQGTTGQTDAFQDAGAAVTELTGWKVGETLPGR